MIERFGTRAIEVGFLLVILYLVFTNASAFSQISASLTNAYTSSIRALQGR